MMPSLTLLTPWQPPSTATIDHALLLARRLERRVAAVRGRLVDRVDEVDLVGLLQDVLHRLAAALGRALRDVGADDLRAVALRVVLRILDRDAEAGEEAVVAQIVDRRLVGGEVERGDLGGLGLVAERRLRPLADQFAGLEVVGGEIARRRRSTGSSGVSSVMTSDAGLARLLRPSARSRSNCSAPAGCPWRRRPSAARSPRPRRRCRRRTCRHRPAG